MTGSSTESDMARTGPSQDERSSVPVIVRRMALSFIALLFFSVLLHSDCSAQQERPTESQVKAAYLYNFGKFVRWDSGPSPTNAFTICVLGKDPFGSALQTTVAGEKIDGENIAIKDLAGLSEIARCRILFISSSEESRLKSILATVRPLNLLTVSDISGFAQRGGMIELIRQEGRVRFEVNLSAVTEAKLTLSSELLKVAVKVIGTGQTREIDK